MDAGYYSKDNLEKAEKVETDCRIVYIATFPPRKCGIATFTQDLTRAMDGLLETMVKSMVVAMNAEKVVSDIYGREVIFQIDQNNPDEYVRVAEALNQNDAVKLVNIQHEFGIFGGDWGLNIIYFLSTLTKPKVINFHTVIPQPSQDLRHAARLLADNVNGITVMTHRSRRILIEDYGIPEQGIRVIPHGIHDGAYISSKQAKAALGFSDKTVLSTFGMLNRGKGLEYVIEALPAVVERYEDFVYIIFGVTHPNILKTEGETYRNSLIERIYRLGLADHVKMYNNYLPLPKLLKMLKATDIYISASLDPNQAVSGTLSYALGMGRPVISTAFAQAKEDVTADVGILVDFRDPQAFTDAISSFMEDKDRQMNLGKNAYFKTRGWTWPNVAIKYAKYFSECAPDLVEVVERKSFPQVKLGHLVRLTDRFGIVQFASLSNPDLTSGYTVDDNARALMVVTLCYDRLRHGLLSQSIASRGKLLGLMNIYLDFISLASRADGYFNNYFNLDRIPNDTFNGQVNLEEATSRALYALSLTSAIGSIPRKIREKAFTIVQEKVKKNIPFQSPRAISWYIKALCVLLEKKIEIPGIDLAGAVGEHCDKLLSLYDSASSPQWRWFESYFTYSNALLSEALLQAYRVTGKDRYLYVGKTTLDFLVEKTFREGIYMPIGQDGWYYRDGKRSHFDQQPEAVMAMVYALKVCYSITEDEHYGRLMYRAFNWFLGGNSLEAVVYDRTTGGCYDGVGRQHINLNQGAESTISYMLARLAF